MTHLFTYILDLKKILLHQEIISLLRYILSAHCEVTVPAGNIREKAGNIGGLQRTDPIQPKCYASTIANSHI
jgi:hypothetical protein